MQHVNDCNCAQTVDDYGNEVTQLARPLPVEYLLVDMAAAFPVNAQYTFHAPNVSFTFPVENRHDDTSIQVEYLWACL